MRLFKTEGGKLINTRTGAAYTTFVLPMGEVVPLALAKLLDQFAREGGNLCLMDTMPRYGMSKAEDKEVETIFENLKNSGCLAFVNDGADAEYPRRLASGSRPPPPSASKRATAATSITTAITPAGLSTRLCTTTRT